ncbi:hypothetical protein BC835DRAFT_1417977 [Cytidiella melzeri]|nr:hypothetical protein BC835DRAFT_1417977 [Cytidiella melzeri]
MHIDFGLQFILFYILFVYINLAHAVPLQDTVVYPQKTQQHDARSEHTTLGQSRLSSGCRQLRLLGVPIRKCADQMLEREIFGSDSDLSEQESEVGSPARRSKPPRDVESSAGDSGDEFQTATKLPKPKRQRRSRKGAEEGEGRLAQRKRKRKPVREEVDLSTLPENEASKLRLDMQIDAILKPKRAPRQKKGRTDDDVLDRAADEEVSRLRETMLVAAAEDEQSNREKMPATSKLRMLPQVMEVLRKTSYAQSITDNNLLEAVKKWLEPLPDKSLPALDIQKEFFPILRKMDFIDKDVLKESKLGKVIVFYTKCKRVTPDIARIANDLVSIWSRPIIKRSASYRDRTIETVSVSRGEGNEKLNTILARARESDKSRVRKNAVAIPSRELGSYTVAPSSTAGIMRNNKSVEFDTERRKAAADRMRRITRKATAK